MTTSAIIYLIIFAAMFATIFTAAFIAIDGPQDVCRAARYIYLTVRDAVDNIRRAWKYRK